MPTFQNKGNHLFVEISEPYSLELFISTVHEIAGYCQKLNLDKVLVDLRKLEGEPDILDRYQIGVEIATAWGPRYKVAVVAREDIINKMAENTAVNRGARLIVTHDENQAFEWLGLNR